LSKQLSTAGLFLQNKLIWSIKIILSWETLGAWNNERSLPCYGIGIGIGIAIGISEAFSCGNGDWKWEKGGQYYDSGRVK
jgi:hypothetical protein